MPRHSVLALALALCACSTAVVEAPTSPTASPAPSPIASAIPSALPSVAPTLPPVTPTPQPATPAPTVKPTPPSTSASYCAVADAITPQRDFSEHAQTYLDWTYALPADYAAPDLVNATTGKASRIAPPALETAGAADLMARRGDPSYATLLSDAPNAMIRAVAYGQLATMRAAALATGHQLVILSAYRSYDVQVQTFDYWVSVGGYQQALLTSARPGHSEHQLGTAIDFGDGSAAPWEYADWATTPTGGWLAAHAADYGFVMSFPKGKTPVTCYSYEPWHYRYVGTALAHEIVASGVTLREFQMLSASSH